jgi:protein disulfide-isomerase-like protein
MEARPDQINPLKMVFNPDVQEINRTKNSIEETYGTNCYRSLKLNEQKPVGVYIERIKGTPGEEILWPKGKTDKEIAELMLPYIDDPKIVQSYNLYKLSIENKLSIISNDTTCIVLNRDHLENGMGEVPINLPLQITIGRGQNYRKFTLCSVVCAWRPPAHYTTLLNCFGKWYHYDDVTADKCSLKEQEMDSEIALKIVGIHGKMFFYYPYPYEIASCIERWDKDDSPSQHKSHEEDDEQLMRDLKLAQQLQYEDMDTDIDDDEPEVCPECGTDVVEDAEFCLECGNIHSTFMEESDNVSWESEEESFTNRLEMLGGGNGGKVIVLTDANFNKLTSKGKWFVDFYAPWCGWCQRLEPIWDKFAAQNKSSVNVAKLDVTANPKTAKKFGIGPVPSIKFMVNGKRVEDYKGERTVNDFRQFVARK